jgi:hypothetical protein
MPRFSGLKLGAGISRLAGCPGPSAYVLSEKIRRLLRKVDPKAKVTPTGWGRSRKIEVTFLGTVTLMNKLAVINYLRILEGADNGKR